MDKIYINFNLVSNQDESFHMSTKNENPQLPDYRKSLDKYEKYFQNLKIYTNSLYLTIFIKINSCIEIESRIIRKKFKKRYKFLQSTR